MSGTLEATTRADRTLAVSAWMVGFGLLTVGLRAAPFSSAPRKTPNMNATTPPRPEIGSPTLREAPDTSLKHALSPLERTPREETKPSRETAAVLTPAPRGEIRFRRGSTRLTSSDRAHLSRLAESLAATRGSVLVEGHADAIGGDLRNLRLSRARARAVARALVAGGLGRARLVIRAYGDFQPRPGHDRRAKAQRRVEVRLLEEVRS